jgi:tight adherence protein B
MSTNVVIIVTAVAVLLAAEAIYYLALYLGQRQRVELHRRLRFIADPGATASLLRERRISRIPAIDRLLRPIPAARRLEKLLLQTDLTWTVATVIALSVLFAGGLTALLMLVLQKNPLLGLIGVPLGLAVPPLLVYNARARRSQKLSEQLPDALDMMVRSLRAGHGISSGFKLVAQEMAPPIAVEFGRCFEEQNLGVEFREAVRHMTERVPDNLDLKIFAVSVVIQHETGGNLVEILEQIADTIRERFKFYGKLRALTAEGKISGYILGALPFVCLLVVALARPFYLIPLVADPIGRGLVVFGLVSWGLGALLMRALIRVEY